MPEDLPRTNEPAIATAEHGEGKAAKPDLIAITKRFWNEKYLPQDEHYRVLTNAIALLFSVASLPLYYVGATNESVRSIVYWIWRTSVFGLWQNTLPYFCGEQLCAPNSTGQANWLLAIPFFVGALISIRLLTFCLEVMERALGINLIARLLDKFLPEKRS